MGDINSNDEDNLGVIRDEVLPEDDDNEEEEEQVENVENVAGPSNRQVKAPKINFSLVHKEFEVSISFTRFMTKLVK